MGSKRKAARSQEAEPESDLHLGLHSGFHSAAILALCVLGVAIYSNTLDVPFVFDDSQNISDNRHIRIARLGAAELWEAAVESPSARPVANLSFALNYYFAGYELAGYHVVNIAIHVINGVLVYFLAMLLLQRGREPAGDRSSRPRALPIAAISLLAAAVFVAHPLQTQSVTYVVQRMNSMATMFYLLALLLFLYGRLGKAGHRRFVLWAGSAACWLLALGSKEIAATLPIVVWLCEWYFFRDLSRDWLVRNFKIALAGIAIAAALGLVYLGLDPLERLSDHYSTRDFSPLERVLTQPRVVVFYLSLLLLPLPGRLNLLHPFETSHSLVDPVTTLLAPLALLALLGLAIRLAPKQRVLSFCILWFLLHLVIESSFIPLEMVFEHRLYLPMFGFALFVAYSVFSLASNQKTLAVAISIVLVASLATAAHLRNQVWRDAVSLWSDVIAKNPTRHRPHNNLGLALEREGRSDAAIHHYNEALRIEYDVAEVHNNLGHLLGNRGQLDEAVQHLSEALRLAPHNVAAHNNLGNVLREQGDQSERKQAIHHLSEAVRLDPGYAEGHYNLGLALAAQGDSEGALRHYGEAVRLRPDFAEAHNNLGLVLAGQGKLDDARARYREALRLRPGFAQAHNNLGLALARQGHLAEAVRQYSEALRLDANYAIAHNNLGVARARQGRAEAAIRSFEAALRIDPEYREARKNLEQALRLVMQNSSRPSVPGLAVPDTDGGETPAPN